jgi:hypothetical protein
LQSTESFLTSWSSFYVLIGSAAAALTGLTFVVITLVAGLERGDANPDGVTIFSSPTVVHFCVALMNSAVLSAPWHAFEYPGIVLGLTGLYGTAYVTRTIVKLSMGTSTYSPDVEDWCWYAIVPLIAYLAILGSGVLLAMNYFETLFVIATASVALIFCGIRNSWDTVTYLTITRLRGDQ